MHLYTQDNVRRVGLSCLVCRRFNEGDQAQAHRVIFSFSVAALVEVEPSESDIEAAVMWQLVKGIRFIWQGVVTQGVLWQRVNHGSS